MNNRYDITLERWQAAQWAEQRENERSRALLSDVCEQIASALGEWKDADVQL